MRFKAVFLFFLLTVSFKIFAAEGRPPTFSIAQEKVLVEHPRALSFLYHMTRNNLNFYEMSEKYSLDSIDKYYSYFLDNGIIQQLDSGDFKFLFLNPYGVWSLRRDGNKNSIYNNMRKAGLNRLAEMIDINAINSSDERSALWVVNTTRLTEEQFQEYKEEMLQVGAKYIQLGEDNLFNKTPNYDCIWIMQLAEKVDPLVADKSHLLFGQVEEFE